MPGRGEGVGGTDRGYTTQAFGDGRRSVRSGSWPSRRRRGPARRGPFGQAPSNQTGLVSASSSPVGVHELGAQVRRAARNRHRDRPVRRALPPRHCDDAGCRRRRRGRRRWHHASSPRAIGRRARGRAADPPARPRRTSARRAGPPRIAAASGSRPGLDPGRRPSRAPGEWRGSGSAERSRWVSLPPTADEPLRRPGGVDSQNANATELRPRHGPFQTSTASKPRPTSSYSHGGPERLRMVDADEGAGRGRGLHRPLDGRPVRLAELPPAIRPPGVPVPAVRRDLDARDRRSAGPRRPARTRRDGRRCCGRSRRGSRGPPRRPRGASRPATSRRRSSGCGNGDRPAASPSAPAAARDGRVGPSGPGRARGGGRPGIEADLDPAVAAARPDLVRPEQDVPGPRRHRPGRIRRRRPVLADDELVLVAAAPAPEPGAAGLRPARVEQADVEGVAAVDERIGVDPIAVRVADLRAGAQPGGTSNGTSE